MEIGQTLRVAADGVTDAANTLADFVIVRAPSHETAARMFEGHRRDGGIDAEAPVPGLGQTPPPSSRQGQRKRTYRPFERRNFSASCSNDVAQTPLSRG